MAFNAKPNFGTGGAAGFGQSTFGSFGTTNAAFGSGGSTTFGTSQPQTTSLFGGQAQTSTFGTQPQATGFGAPQATGTTGFGTSGGSLFGSSTTGTTFGAQNTFGNAGTGSLFGAKAPAATNPFGGGGTTSTGFGMFGGATTSTVGTTGFGTLSTFQPTATTQPSLFSGFGQQNQQTSNALSFGANVKPLGTSTGFGGFSGFGQPQQTVQQPQPALSATDLLYSSIYQVNIYGDERDTIIAKFNMLMAFAGLGKGYFNASSSVDYTPNNDLYKFTSIVYNSKPTGTQKDSLVYLSLNKKYEQLQKDESSLVSSLNALFGDQPHLSVVIYSLVHIDADKSRVIFYMNEKQSNGMNKRVTNTLILNHLLQPMPKQQLTQLGVYDVNVYQSLDEDTLNQYLENPPPGINAIVWKNAQRDNPDPEKFIPVPVIGFEGIKQRIRLQEEEAKLQQSFLNSLAHRISELQNEHTKSVSTIVQYNQNLLNINNRLLKVIVQQEITRNIGLSLSPHEELIKCNLENVVSLLNSNEYNFKSKISEMLSKMKLECAYLSRAGESGVDQYVTDESDLNDIKLVFAMNQKAIATLLGYCTEEEKCIQVIKQGLDQILNQQ